MRLLATLFISFSLLSLSAQAEDYLQIENPWVRAAPPNARVMGGFLTIKNPSEYTIWITGASSPQFEDVELHESSEEDGISRMFRLNFIKLTPGETVNFKPFGKHLMLFTPKQPLKPGSEVHFVLKLGNGDLVKFMAPVKKP